MAWDIIGRHPAPWAVAFRQGNADAGDFWRQVADEAFGSDAWREEQRPVPGVTGAPADHWIKTI